MPSLPLAVTVGYGLSIAYLAYSIQLLVRNRLLPALSGDASKKRKANVAIRPVAKVDPRGFTKEELIKFNGESSGTPIYVSVKNVVFEVMPQFYGIGEGYHVYAGKDVSRSLAKSRVDDVLSNKDYAVGVSDAEMEVLDAWFNKFQKKYAVVGWFLPDDDYYKLPSE